MFFNKYGYEKILDNIASCFAQAKFEKVDCDTMNYCFTANLSCPQSKDVLCRASKESLATHIPNFQQKLQYDDK